MIPNNFLKLLFSISIIFLFNIQPVFAHGTNNIGGTWNSVTLSGKLNVLSPKLENFHWLVMNQARWKDDSSQGYRFSENLLFAQLGYTVNEHSSIWLGYVHDWIYPLDQLAVHENRPYQDFVWADSFSDLKLTSRTRLEQRIRQDTGNVGVRARQMLMVNYPLHFIHKDLSAYVGDEVLAYLNTNTFGRTGFSENRIFTGLSYQVTRGLGIDLGYLGQYVETKRHSNDFYTHNIQMNLRYAF